MILILRALGVGDLLAAVPALRAVRAAFPDRTLALATPAWLTPLVDLIGGVDLIVPPDELPALAPPELAINLHGRGPESHRRLQALEPAKLWAFANVGAGFPDGPAWTDEEHEVSRWCRMLAYYGVPADPANLDLPGLDGQRDVTVVHPGAKSPSRRWPPERFAAVVRALTERGHHVVVTGSAAERELAERVGAGLPPDAVRAGRTGLGELAALVARARLVVSGDTGIAHLATAYRAPSVVLFGPVPPHRWGPPPDRPWHRAIWHGTRADPGDATGPGVHPALLAVSVEEVLACLPGVTAGSQQPPPAR